MSPSLQRLVRWESLLLLLLIAVMFFNAGRSPHYLSLNNQINLFAVSIEKIIVAIVMTLIIINAEIDLSVASIMGLSACALAYLWEIGVPAPIGIPVALLIGLLAGLFNGYWNRLRRSTLISGDPGGPDRISRSGAYSA